MPESATVEVLADSPGIVIHVAVQPGARVNTDDELLIVESSREHGSTRTTSC
jgi:biotin carboxyl carrier protein